MRAEIKARGGYEFFETDHGHTMLSLDDGRRFVWLEGDEGEILAPIEEEPVRARTRHSGEFVVVDFAGDPEFRDMLHLFLELEGAYHEFMLPDGLPSGADLERRIIRTGETLQREELEASCGRSLDAAQGAPAESETAPPVADYPRLTVDDLKERMDGMSRAQIERLREYERGHKERKTLLRAIERRLEKG